MNKDMVKDILRKGAEDVEQGMWCSGSWFRFEGDVKSQVVWQRVLESAQECQRREGQGNGSAK